jgi:hypothetical protein
MEATTYSYCSGHAMKYFQGVMNRKTPSKSLYLMITYQRHGMGFAIIVARFALYEDCWAEYVFRRSKAPIAKDRFFRINSR